MNLGRFSLNFYNVYTPLIIFSSNEVKYSHDFCKIVNFIISNINGMIRIRRVLFYIILINYSRVAYIVGDDYTWIQTGKIKHSVISRKLMIPGL